MARTRTKRKGSGRKSYSIIVDGQTEVWYLQLMKKHEDLPRIDIRPELSKKRKLKQQFDLVEKNALDYDKVIWLLDFDVIIKNRQTKEFSNYYEKLKSNKRVVVLINNPCLEFWFLLHFVKMGKWFAKCDNVIRELKKSGRMENYQKSEKYFKNAKSDIYLKLQHLQSEAMLNATNLGRFDPSNVKSAKAEIFEIFNIVKNG